MTEEEAKTKWCHRTTDASPCIGSACMAWRATPARDGETKLDAIRRYRAEGMADLGTAKEFVEANPGYMRRAAQVGGFCGLAGRPE